MIKGDLVIDIQNYKRRYEGELRRVMNSQISEQNKRLILEFNRYYVLEGISLSRRVKVLESLTRIASKLNKDFDKATKEDLMDFIESLEKTQYSEWSKHTFKSILKRFYKWLKRQ